MKFITFIAAFVVVSVLVMSSVTAAAVRSEGKASLSLPVPRELWKATVADFDSIGYPCILDGIAFIVAANKGGATNTLYAFDRFSGAQLWNVTTNTLGAYCTTGEGKVFHANMDYLYAREARTGKKLWEFSPKGMRRLNGVSAWPGKPTYVNGKVYNTWYNTQMVQIDAQSGNLVAATTFIVGGRIWNFGERLFFTAVFGEVAKYSIVHVLASDINRVVWQARPSTDDFITLATDGYVAATKFLLPNTNTLKVVGFNVTTGAEAWKNELPDAPHSDYNTAVTFTVTATMGNASVHVYCFGYSGRQRWSLVLPTSEPFNVFTYETTTIIQTTNHNFVIDTVTGQLLGDFQLADSYIGTMIDTTYILGGNGNTVAAIEIGSR